MNEGDVYGEIGKWLVESKKGLTLESFFSFMVLV